MRGCGFPVACGDPPHATGKKHGHQHEELCGAPPPLSTSGSHRFPYVCAHGRRGGSHGLHRPPGSSPPAQRQDVTPVEEPGNPHHRAEFSRVELAVLAPFGQVKHHVSTLTGLFRLGRVVELREGLPGVVGGQRIVDPDHRALRRTASATLSAGESRTSSVPGLNVAPSTATFWPARRAADQVAGQPDSHPPAGAVELVDFAQEPHRVGQAQLGGPGHERPDILGQASTPVSQASGENLATDPAVVSEGVGQRDDVRSGGLAYV